jgi:hypothetical protein
MLFTLVYCNYKPKLSQSPTAAEQRIEHIIELMKHAKLSIHDLSRVEVNQKSKLPRFNMPLEYGIDLGLYKSGIKAFKRKRFLLFDREPYRYKAFISDIGGSDIGVHNNKPEDMIKVLRDWLINFKSPLPSYYQIWTAYTEFEIQFRLDCKDSHLSPNQINAQPFTELIQQMNVFIKAKAYKLKSPPSRPPI